MAENLFLGPHAMALSWKMGDRPYLVNGRGLLTLAIPESRQYPISTFHLPEKHVETVAFLFYEAPDLQPSGIY